MFGNSRIFVENFFSRKLVMRTGVYRKLAENVSLFLMHHEQIIRSADRKS